MSKVTFCCYDSHETLGGPFTWTQRLRPALRLHGIESQCLFLTWGNSNTGPALEALRAQGFDCPAVACHNFAEDRVRWILARSHSLAASKSRDWHLSSRNPILQVRSG